MSSNAGIISMFLHENSTEADDGITFPLNGVSNLAIEITGTATSSEVIFEAKIKDNWYSILGVHVTNGDTATLTTSKNEIWRFETTALTHFKARINSISGGNLTIYGWGAR